MIAVLQVLAKYSNTRVICLFLCFSQPVEDISVVSWNRQVQHILASANPSGKAVVWDLRKNEPIIKISDHSNRVGGLNTELSSHYFFKCLFLESLLVLATKGLIVHMSTKAPLNHAILAQLLYATVAVLLTYAVHLL